MRESASCRCKLHREARRMEASERVVNDGEDAEEEHVLSLRALLHDLVRRKGRIRAANELGLDPRTVGACMEGEGMSWRVREALERAVRGDDGGAAARRRERSDALEQDVTRRLEGVEAVGEEHARSLRRLERRLARLEGVRGAPKPSDTATKREPDLERDSLGRRRYPELVTKEPHYDDEEVYGKAWPLIDEWRALWRVHSNDGRGLSWLRVEERIRELEVAMLEEHGLTLPPETMPLTGLDRYSQLNWRKATLRDVRRSRAKRDWLLWVITLGRWKK